MNRRYDIDWLRVFALGLLIVYHISIVFQPWSYFIYFLRVYKVYGGLREIEQSKTDTVELSYSPSTLVM